VKNLSSKELKRIGYIYASGYTPASDFTLKEWLEARELFWQFKSQILMVVGEYRARKE